MMSLSHTILAITVGLLCLEFSMAEIKPDSCKINPTVFGPNATSCSDVRDSAECKAIFAASTATARDPQCEKPELEDIALDCANTCLACCETAAYTCGDDPLSPINCTANVRYCKDPSWNTVMSQYCTGTCGLCISGSGCKDVNTGCKDMITLCNDINFNTYMKDDCQKTCRLCPAGGSATTASPGTGTCSDVATNCAPNAGLCNNASYRDLMTTKCPRTCNRCSGSSSGGSTCTDTNANCAAYVSNGFCTSTFYTTDQKRQYCASSCSLC
uniref:ShKT domain-containing protein n=1 Tax=Panagrolaimus sp. ES5 TaxID=591445 RepID=A0AC34G8P5_9BILA